MCVCVCVCVCVCIQPSDIKETAVFSFVLEIRPVQLCDFNLITHDSMAVYVFACYLKQISLSVWRVVLAVLAVLVLKQFDRIRNSRHRCAHIVDLALLPHNVDFAVGSVEIELGRGGFDVWNACVAITT